VDPGEGDDIRRFDPVPEEFGDANGCSTLDIVAVADSSISVMVPLDRRGRVLGS